MHKKTLLIVAHMPSDNTRRLGEALQRGATGTGDTGVQARLLSPFDTHPEDVMQADGVVLMKPKNLGYMSGAFKDFLDRTCYPTLEHKQGLPYALVVRAGNDGPRFLSNHAGGILGGISSGQDIVARFAVKPTSSILTPRQTINRDGTETEIVTKGRHDPCVGIRAVPVAIAMTACVLADHALRHRAQCG